MTAAEKAIEKAKELKSREEICRVYNGYRPLPRGYRVKVDDFLCATYVSAIFVALGWTDIVPPECAAWRLAKNMEALDRYKAEPGRTPNSGDLIFFGGKAINTIEHVGIVAEVAGSKIYYYDINAYVKKSVCNVGYRYITGYGCPDFASKGDTPEPAPAPAPEQRGFQVGDLVTVNPGALWYKGQTIKASVFKDQWYIMSLKGDRAVLGMNKAETKCVQSPIHTADITLVGKAAPADEGKTDPEAEQPYHRPAGERRELTASVLATTLEKLERLAKERNISVGDVIDSMMG